MTSTKVTIYVGPQVWFEEETQGLDAERFPELVDDREANRRTVVVRDERHEPVEDDDVPRPRHVTMSSTDFSTISEAWINSFASLVRALRPEALHVQNPPAHVHEQLLKAFNATERRYNYPKLSLDALSSVRRDFASRIVGQDNVQARLLAALYPLTLPEASRPVVLMLYGPSGVGKTETARLINTQLDGHLLRVQFSMYHSEKFASYIFGGSTAERSFAQDLLNRESGVILIDEFDKAHATFHSAFYELFDEGVFVDKNYRVELGPAVIICTSNYASELDVRAELGDALSSRFTAMIEYSKLAPAAIEIIADQLIRARFDALRESDRAYVDPERVRDVIATGSFTNVRTLGKAIDEIMSHLVVTRVLEALEAVSQPGRDDA